MEYTNEMTLEIVSRSCNESLARVTVAAFATQLNPTLKKSQILKPPYQRRLQTALFMLMTIRSRRKSGLNVRQVKESCLLR